MKNLIPDSRSLTPDPRSPIPSPINVYPYAYGNAAQNTGCKQGALVLQKALEQTNEATRYHWHTPLQVSNHKQQQDALSDVIGLNTVLAESTRDSVANHHFFITLGGDHSCAIGSWSGAASAIAGDLGLIWFDAHMDSHTPETTPSNNIHGMPLATLLGHGNVALTQLLSATPKLKPENVVLIGVRSYEPGEALLLKKLGVTVFYIQDIETVGMKNVIAQSVEIVTRNTAAFGISVDLDGFDPTDAPGVGTREEDGVDAKIFLENFHLIAEHPKLIGMDIVELNPNLDHNQKTEQLAVALCNAASKSR